MVGTGDDNSLHRRNFVALGLAGALATAVDLRPAWAEASPAVRFADGSTAPALGQGSWHMASGNDPKATEDAMRLGISLGLTLIDTSDDYGEGHAEEMVGNVLAGRRDKVFLVSKLSPSEVGDGSGVERALEASLKRLRTDHLDLYLLHFPGGEDLRATVEGFQRAVAKGLTKRWGVSNFSTAQMEALFAIPEGRRCATNQVLYNPADRAAEVQLIPWCTKHGMPIMAYSPLGAGGKAALLSNPVLTKLADARGVSPAAIALAWVMRDGRTMAITETGSTKHVRQDAAAIGLRLTAAELKAIDSWFPPPHAG